MQTGSHDGEGMFFANDIVLNHLAAESGNPTLHAFKKSWAGKTLPGKKEPKAGDA